jgi:hypothetical protein
MIIEFVITLQVEVKDKAEAERLQTRFEERQLVGLMQNVVDEVMATSSSNDTPYMIDVLVGGLTTEEEGQG